MKTRGPRLLAACLLVALLVTGSTGVRTVSSEADRDFAAEAAEARSRWSAEKAPTPTAAARISVPPQPAALAKNRLYRTGRLTAAGCGQPDHEPVSLTSVRAYYTELLACMDKAWAPAVREAGFAFHPPKLVVTKGRSASSPCEYIDGLPFYCGDTIYMDAASDIEYFDDEPDETLVWMAFNLAHEYGHHVQALTGILEARYERGLTLNGVDAALEESRRVELQASCLAGVYLGAHRRWFEFSSTWQDDYEYVVSNVEDPDRDHGSPPNHRRWSMAGLTAADPAACNTYKAGSRLVS